MAQTGRCRAWHGPGTRGSKEEEVVTEKKHLFLLLLRQLQPRFPPPLPHEMEHPLPITSRLRTRTITIDLPVSAIPPGPSVPQLGTWAGVFIPTCEFMWSVLLFVRFGIITGQSGWLVALLIVGLCACTVVITGSSIAAIATNGIPTGGVFAILEKSFGFGIGGAIALIYYIGLVILIAVEIQGSGESIESGWRQLSHPSP